MISSMDWQRETLNEATEVIFESPLDPGLEAEILAIFGPRWYPWAFTSKIALVALLGVPI